MAIIKKVVENARLFSGGGRRKRAPGMWGSKLYEMWARWRLPVTQTSPAPQGETRLRKLLDADLEQVSLVRLRGGRFVYVNEELLANISHDIRTSTGAILGMADLLAETQLTAEQRHYLEAMITNGNALLHLINTIFDLANIESGRLRLEESEFGLQELVEEVAETLSLRAHEKGLELAVRILPDVPLRLMGDPSRLRQVLINLLGNAIKFTERGEVVLTVQNDSVAEPGALRFAVRDSGIGIVPDRIEAIFQTFTQGDSSISRNYGGSGLGLSITKRLVELMGGRIWVESERGKGSTFHFIACFRVLAPAKPDAAAEKLEGLRALVVDDNAANRSILGEILAQRGADVAEADSGETALAECYIAGAAGKPYRLVLLDCRMPAMDGFEMAQRLRAQSGGAGPIVMMLTSDDLNPKLTRLRELGITTYLVKPVKRSDLFRAIGVAAGITRVVQEKPAQPSLKTALPVTERTLRILLAEDSPHNRLLVKEYLKKLPYELDTAENGEVAVEKFMRGRYDLALMDLRMPVMDGYTAVRKIRRWEQEQQRAPTPIVAFTASALEDDLRSSIEAGCTTHLSKPIKKSLLLAAIHQLTNPTANRADSDRPEGEEPAALASTNGQS